MSVGEAAVPKLATNSMVATNHRSFALTIFLSAFLLFQVQLIVGKQLLPWFGGTPAVWNTCLVFFQLLLLGGYAYAHWVTERLKAWTLTRTHIALLLVSVALLAVLTLLWRSPIFPGDSLRPANPANPMWDILLLLTASVGLPFFLLSAFHYRLAGAGMVQPRFA